MSTCILTTGTCDTPPHQSRINPMRSIAVTLVPILALVSSTGKPILADCPSNQDIIRVDSSKMSYSMLSEGGMFIYSASDIYKKIQNNIEKINAISLLADNWDGDGATAFPSSIIESAKKIVYILSIQPEVFPTLRNSIQLEYENDDNEYLEFEVFDDHIKYFYYDHRDHSITRNVSVEEINAIVNAFYE